MADINIKGPIVPSDEAWIYDWFGIECANPKAVNDILVDKKTFDESKVGDKINKLR